MKASSLLPILYMTGTSQALAWSASTQSSMHLLARYVDDPSTFEQALLMRRDTPTGTQPLSIRSLPSSQVYVSSLVKRASPPASRSSSPRHSGPSASSSRDLGGPSHQLGQGIGPSNQSDRGRAHALPGQSGGGQQNPSSSPGARPSAPYLSKAAHTALGGLAATGAMVGIGGLTNWADPTQATTSVIGMTCIGAAALSAACIRHLNTQSNPAQNQRLPSNRQQRPPPPASGSSGGGAAAGSSLEMSNVPLRGHGHVASDDPANLVR